MKPLVYYPAKLLETYSAGPYTAKLWRRCRLEDEPESWEVQFFAGYYCGDVGTTVSDFALARDLFEDGKERAIIELACKAMGIKRNRVTEIVTQSTS